MNSSTPYWYLATPYRGHSHGFDAAAAEAAVWAAWLIDSGVDVYSPIVHSHPIAQYVTMAPPENDFWLARQVPFMVPAAGLLVAHIAGWERSTGIAWEREWFKAAGKPIHDLPLLGNTEPLLTIPSHLNALDAACRRARRVAAVLGEGLRDRLRTGGRMIDR